MNFSSLENRTYELWKIIISPAIRNPGSDYSKEYNLSSFLIIFAVALAISRLSSSLIIFPAY